jgi:hypothetical protein
MRGMAAPHTDCELEEERTAKSVLLAGVCSRLKGESEPTTLFMAATESYRMSSPWLSTWLSDSDEDRMGKR